MPQELPTSVTDLLRHAREGHAGARDRLLELTYGELRLIARRVAGPADEPTLHPTALVHEAWLKLSAGLGGLKDRRHFLAVASLAMRQVLADQARARRRLKREDPRRGRVLTEVDGAAHHADFDLVVLDDLLSRLQALDARQARVVELRFLGGLTIAETAEELGVSHATVEEDWSLARAWLRRELARGE